MIFSDKYNHHSVPGQTFIEPSLTQQHFASDADINTIVDRYTRTGILPQPSLPAIFADVSSLPTDYQEALHRVREADAAFLQLPATVRREFDNNPGKFLAAMQDPSFLPRAVELGLVNLPSQSNSKAAPEPQPAQDS